MNLLPNNDLILESWSGSRLCCDEPQAPQNNPDSSMSVGMVSSKQKWDLVLTVCATVLQQIRCLCTECMLSDILHVLHVTARTGMELLMCMTGAYSKTTLHTIAASA
jgi:hypothetical protein